MPDQTGSSDLPANVRTDSPSIYGPYDQIFPAHRLGIRNEANTFVQYFQASTTITANRTLTLPAVDTDDTIMSRTSADVMTNKEVADMLVFDETTAPSATAAKVKLYAKDKAGTTELFYKNEAGTERDLSAGGGGGGGATALDDLTDVTLTAPSDNDVLKYDAGSFQWINAPPQTHALLSSEHSDTTAASVVRGDLITGQGASPTWTRLALGSSGQYMRSDGTDAAWAVIATGDLPADVIKNSQDNSFGAHYFDVTRMSAPSDPSANNGRFYVKQIDANNDGFFVKLKKATAFVEVQIA